MKKKPEHIITSANGRNLTNKTITFMDGTSRTFKPNILGIVGGFELKWLSSILKMKKKLRVYVVLSL